MSDIETKPRTREETILEGLNEAQRGAVLHGDGPLLIVAGAGTGKTTVLTRRIAHLITTKRARPEEILALTFTEKAAREMSERSIEKLSLPSQVVDGSSLLITPAVCRRKNRIEDAPLGLFSLAQKGVAA